MRYKEFATSEAIDRFMGNLLGTPSNSISSVIDKISGSTDEPKPNSTSDSNGEVLPVSGPISSPFGMRARGNHLGTDFAVPVGTRVKAPESGIIQSAGTDGGHAGTYITLNTGRTVHKFFHLSKIMVSTGDRVKQGEVIALTGNTGLSTGPHLHWEKHQAGRAVDPMANIG